MLGFVFGQLFHRKTRSVVTILGVAIGVVLVTLIVGLANGQLSERARREASTGAEILVRPAGSGMSPLQATLAIDLSMVPEVRAVEGVAAVVPMGQHLERSKSGFGWKSIDGVDFAEFAVLNGTKILEGRAPVEGKDEVVVDTVFAKTAEGKLNQTVDFGGKQLTIVGVYSPESMSRLKIPLADMQEFYNARGSASILMVKLHDGVDVDQVARALGDRLPENQIILSRDLPSFYARGIPALNTFLNVVVGVSVLISTLVILLTMYTTVIERTRQIGVLKSLGASRTFIAVVIESEALIISSIGVAVGFAAAVAVAFAIRNATSLQIEFDPKWVLVTGVLGIASGLIGAMYPALRAARLDPVDALSYD